MTSEPGNVAAAAAERRDLRAAVRGVLADEASLRQWTLVANDGIIATAGILEGFAGAGATDRTLLIAAMVATIAGMLAAGGAQWAEADAEREAQLQAAAEEAESLAARPEAELHELVDYYEEKGLSPDLARAVAEQLKAHDAIAAQLEIEHGVREVVSRTHAAVTGVGASIAYATGAAIPLLITVFAPVAIEAWAIVVAVAVSLVVTSVVGARTGQMHVGRTVARTLAVGLGTMAVSYALGKLIF
jgi:VIT1/CCC1 family predicted Fe2+/Mn2+ transporter